jgi:hypothetical protein
VRALGPLNWNENGKEIKAPILEEVAA